ncbi:Immunoglobulin V-set domain [Trinorchestia longiramus]|nr:Immunoglobulin V-set domain [Trinorchestia longiramus]
MDTWVAVSFFFMIFPHQDTLANYPDMSEEVWESKKEQVVVPGTWSLQTGRIDARASVNAGVVLDSPHPDQLMLRQEAVDPKSDASLIGNNSAQTNRSHEGPKLFVPSSYSITKSHGLKSKDTLLWKRRPDEQISKDSFADLNDNFKPVDLSLPKTVPPEENFRSSEFSGTRTRWKKQSKDKNSSGGHWIEYDFDEGTSTTTVDPSLPENPVGLKNPTLLVGPWVEEPTVRKSKAYFGGQNNTHVSAQIDTTANLPCLIYNRDDHETVSWIRSRDHHLITVGRQTYSSDNRFSVNFNRHLNQWTLHLRYVQPRDAGEYICQLSTDPVMVYLVKLSVTEATSVIKGGGERYVHEGSSVRLECALQNHTQSPDYVFWYHNGTMINYDLNRKVEVEATVDGSVLTLLSVGRTDSGNYTCAPANAQFASIALHIILGDTLAAMKVSGSPEAASPLFVQLLLLLHCTLLSERL